MMCGESEVALGGTLRQCAHTGNEDDLCPIPGFIAKFEMALQLLELLEEYFQLVVNVAGIPWTEVEQFRWYMNSEYVLHQLC